MIDYSFHYFYHQVMIDKNKKKQIPPIFKKMLCFSNIVHVYLIPINYEIPNYQDLWWTETELVTIRHEAFQEIKQLMLQSTPYMNFKDAKKLLYQPNNIRYDATNFAFFE